MPTTEERVYKVEKRLNAGETILRESMADAADIAETMQGLTEEDKSALEAKRQAAEHAIADYHNCAASTSVKGGVTPQSGGGPK